MYLDASECGNYKNEQSCEITVLASNGGAFSAASSFHSIKAGKDVRGSKIRRHVELGEHTGYPRCPPCRPPCSYTECYIISSRD